MLRRDWRNAGGEAVGDDCEDEEGDIVLFGETDGSGGTCEGGAKGTREKAEGNLQVDGIFRGGGLDGVDIKDGILGHRRKSEMKSGVHGGTPRLLIKPYPRYQKTLDLKRQSIRSPHTPKPATQAPGPG